MKNAVVTGASTGIGYATVQKLLDDGWRVFGSVRTKADAKKLSSAFGERFVPLVFDVTDEKAITKAVASVRKMLDGKTLDGLVNNAGIALSDPLLMQSTDDFRQQLEVNVVGTFAVSKLFAPLLGADPSLTGAKGRIVNISSTAGKVGLPFLGGYVASKHAVEGLSDSMRRELLVHGIDVIVVEPGFVVTPIWDKAEEAINPHLKGTVWETSAGAFNKLMLDMGRAGDPPSKVGAFIHKALTAAKPKTRYAPVYGKFSNFTLPKMLPDRVLDWVVSKQVGLKRES